MAVLAPRLDLAAPRAPRRAPRVVRIADRLRPAQEPLRRIARATAATTDPNATLQAIATALLGFDGTEACAVYLRDDAEGESVDRLRLVTSAWRQSLPDGQERPAAPGAGSGVEQAIRRSEPQRIRAASDAPTARRLVIPLGSGRDRLGVLVLDSPRRSAYGAVTRRHARAIGELAAQAVAAARRLAAASRGAVARAELLAASQAATTTEDTGEVLAGIARACLGVAGAECCGIYLWDPGANELEVGVEATDERWPGSLRPGTRLPLAEWPSMGAALAERTPRILRRDDLDLGARERGRYEEEGVWSSLVVPLQVPAGCLGLLKLFRRTGRPFSREDLQLGQDLAAQAALAIHSAQLRAEIGLRTQEQAILLRVSQAATSSLASGDVLAEIARACLGVAGAECCGIELWRPERDELEVIAQVTVPNWPGTAAAGTRYPLGRWPAIRDTLAGSQPVCFAGTDPALNNPEHGRLLQDGVRTALAVPMLAGRECVGLLWLYSRRGAAFVPRGIRLAQQLASQAALAAQNAHLLEGARRRAEEQAALLRVSHVVNAGNELASVLPHVARECLGVSGVEGATIEVWDPVAEETRVVARAFVPGWPTHEVLGARFSLRDRPTLRSVLETREPLILPGDGSPLSEGEREALAVDGIQSLLIVPVLFGTDCRGAVTLLSRRAGAFPLNALWFAQDLAAQIAQAMERARLHAALREQAETDGLTGVLNHRAIMETLDRELALARRRGGSFGVLVIDLDDFKLFNDTHGHLVGDRVLRDVAALLRASVREVDAVGRYGGDEFLLVLPDTDPAGAARVANRILGRAALRTLPVGELRLPLRLSVGPATYPQDGDTRQELISRADAGMYAAKDAGGGKVGTPGQGTASLQLTAYGALTGLVKAVDRKDRYTKEHSELVAHLSNALGRFLGLSAADREALDIAARLHDVGKIAVPDAILRKPGRLAPDEIAVLRQHVTFGELIVQGVPHAASVRAAIAAHHERWDGHGYPRGLTKGSIPLLGRILALADAWAAMTADRPYRKGLAADRAAQELRAGAGAQFDPSLVPPFLQVLVDLGILAELHWEPIDEPSPPPMPAPEGAPPPVRTATDRLMPIVG